MSEYRRLDLSTLNFSDETVSYEDALAHATPFDFKKEIISGQKELQITDARKDYEKKCVKLAISC